MDEFMFELDKKVNMGKISDNDFKESKSISLIRDLLEKNNKIKVRTTEADKIPDLDGRISILDKNKHDRIIVEVQSKTLPEEYNENKPYHYDCDTKVLNVVKYNKSFNPVVLFLSDIKNNYMLSTFSNIDSNISDVLKDWMNKCINEFYNVYMLHPKFCCNDVLSEIVFDFLDNITYLSDRIKSKNSWDYYKDKEELNVIHSYINGLTKFYKTIWNDREKYPDAKVLEPVYKVINKFIIFNPLITFSNSKKLLEKCIFENNTEPFKENIFLNNHVDMDLVMMSIIELEKRGIKEISRIHSKNDKNLVENVFTKLKESYEYTKDKLGLKDKQIINGQFIIYYFEEKENAYCLEYNDNKTLEIVFKNEKEDKYEDIQSNSNQFGTFKDFSRIKCPLYNFTRLLINKGCMEAQGMDFEFISESLDVFNMKDFPILTTNIRYH